MPTGSGKSFVAAMFARLVLKKKEKYNPIIGIITPTKFLNAQMSSMIEDHFSDD